MGDTEQISCKKQQQGWRRWSSSSSSGNGVSVMLVPLMVIVLLLLVMFSGGPNILTISSSSSSRSSDHGSNNIWVFVSDYPRSWLPTHHHSNTSTTASTAKAEEEDRFHHLDLNSTAGSSSHQSLPPVAAAATADDDHEDHLDPIKHEEEEEEEEDEEEEESDDDEDYPSSADSVDHASSSSPPDAAPTFHGHHHHDVNASTKEVTLNISTVGPMNDSDSGLTTRGPPKEYNELERLEAGLRRARAAIKQPRGGAQNQTLDHDYVPVGPMYWNANAFHRSYLEMEKQLKVFVYEEGEPPVFHNGPCKSIYSMEGTFIHKMEINSQFRTRDPRKAHVFFLPFSVTMLVQFVYVRNSHDFSPIKQTVVDYVNVIAEKYPFWNRSLGADHFMLACHDWGPETSRSVPYLHRNSIRALCNANTSEGFNPAKDVSFPEINLQTGGTNGLLGGPSPSRRPILAFFAGGLHGPIRSILLEHWENKDEDVRVHRYLPKGISYYDMMRKSKYCICPSGYEVASPRVVEALYTGCVPVLISDHYVPPFSDVLNWKAFSVEVLVREIPNLKRILMGISQRQYIRLQRRGVQVRRHFEVNSAPKRFDVFHMILHSIWLRRLNVRVHEIN
ncbi:probable glycosyltransferase At5g03795 [Malania oleifera]|uniref:probable glycosyltransferase At5g03795 n=1 Tax=Malania oleifera TaxID=397392 RepID=UPI0025AE5A64|nr:probable glycosyltransferase At5g03795 [Malania oleifera]